MTKPEVIAFYLPQYHPTKENDSWYGEGFTEWTNVRSAQPLFPGHQQPIMPGELGYYDLRDASVRQRQAELALEAGVSAFCYYHYWFGGGRMMLEQPLFQMLEEKDLDMPFCLCWANHLWYKKTWNAETSVLDQTLLLDINYGDASDWELHFRTLLPAFQDSRYYRIDGRLAFVLYRAQDIPQLDEWKTLWNRLALENGLPEFYFMTYVDDPAKLRDPIQRSCEKEIVMLRANVESLGRTEWMRKFSRFARTWISQKLGRSLSIFRYPAVRRKLSGIIFADESVIPTLLPNWDNTARRAEGASVLSESSPEQFYLHCRETFRYLRGKENKLVFLKSWNEWGEGNYMEPDSLSGKGYIRALRRALDEFSASPSDRSLRILVVGSTNRHSHFAPFITEQADALRAQGCVISYFAIRKKGFLGYLSALPELKKAIREFEPDIVHAHYGLSGLLATMQNLAPVVVTYHGSDINEADVYRYSRLAMVRSAWNVFVSQRTVDIAAPREKFSLVPCGINLPKSAEDLGLQEWVSSVLEEGKKHILFAGSFSNAIKDSALAQRAVDCYNSLHPSAPAQLVELRGFSRNQVNALMYACDAFLLTSKTEGSPQVVKEAMACGCPIVSVDVGDVAERTAGLLGCYVCPSRQPEELASLLEKAIAYGNLADTSSRNAGRSRIIALGLDNETIAKQLMQIYYNVLK